MGEENAAAAAAPTTSENPVAILQEHVAFLRAELTTKRTWYEQMLEVERGRVSTLTRALDEVKWQREQLRVALAEAVREVVFHNTTNDHTTEADMIERWEELLS